MGDQRPSGKPLDIAAPASGSQPDNDEATEGSDDDITVSSDPSVAAALERRLLADLAEVLPQGVNTSVVLAARLRDGALIGGLVGSTSYGWLLVKVLWTDPAHRGRGVGRRLMVEAERRAMALGCHSAWLDTSNPAAHRLYLHLGWEEFGRLDNAPDDDPPGHRRWFLRKTLGPGAGAPAERGSSSTGR
ncbi:MAG: GNAT family N-acetyltransferase [Actinomycetota bacterium]